MTGKQRGQWVAFVSQAKPHIELKAFPLCCHLDTIGFSRAGKSNASFKTYCFLLDRFSPSLMCDSFMPSWTQTACDGHSKCKVPESMLLSTISQGILSRKRLSIFGSDSYVCLNTRFILKNYMKLKYVSSDPYK